MKKLFTLITLFFSTITLFAQFAPEYIIREDFNTYAGTAITTPEGWFISYNNSSTGSNGSYYTSSQSSGVSPNAYKFRVDGSYLITPDLTVDADTLKFWLKGNSVDTLSAFTVYEGVDTNTFTVLDNFDHIAAAGTQYSYGLKTGTRFIKFMYEKSAGNVAFDDVEIFANGTVSVSKNLKSKLSITPSISPSGEFKVNDIGAKDFSSIEVFDLLGNKISYKSLSHDIIKINGDSGCYIVKVTKDGIYTTQRVIVQ